MNAAILGMSGFVAGAFVAAVASRVLRRTLCPQLALSLEEMKWAVLACEEYTRGHGSNLGENPVRLTHMPSRVDPEREYWVTMHLDNGEFWFGVSGVTRMSALKLLASMTADLSDNRRPHTVNLRKAPRNRLSPETGWFELIE